MSDSHDRWDHLEKAIQIANTAWCKHLLFAGDFISPPGIETLKKFNGLVKFVWGNNDGEKLWFTRIIDKEKKIDLCGDIYEGKLGGKRIFMNHYPRISELAAKSGQFDLCIFGHTHVYHNEKVGKCLIINPGEIQGYKTGNVTFVIYDTTLNTSEKLEIN